MVLGTLFMYSLRKFRDTQKKSTVGMSSPPVLGSVSHFNIKLCEKLRGRLRERFIMSTDKFSRWNVT